MSGGWHVVGKTAAMSPRYGLRLELISYSYENNNINNNNNGTIEKENKK